MLAQAIFGWPFVILALLLSGLGLFKQNHVLLFFSALLITPFSFYLGGGLGLWRLALLIPFLQLYAAYMIRKKRQKKALIFALPMLFLSAWTAVLVLSQ